jgi:hypothetical protein
MGRLSPGPQNSREAARLIYLKANEAEFRMAGASVSGVGRGRPLLPLPMKIRADIRAALAAGVADEALFDVG